MKENTLHLKKKNLIVNGIPVTTLVDPEAKLSDVIRKQLGLTGTKVGCRTGQCGACSVLLDGKVVRSCVTTMKNIRDAAEVTTIEGIGTPADPHPLQQAFIRYGATQCGFCTPGFIVSAKGLLDHNNNPSREEVRDWFQKNRNACRCTGYKPIVDAVMAAAKVLRGDATPESLAYRAPEDGKVFGTEHPRPSALAKVTGTLDYGADLGLKLPEGTLRLALVQATVSHAKILSIETRNAENMPGVERILTHKDVQGTNRINGMVTYEWNKGDGFDRPILCDEKVFQFGDALAIVCADTEEHARAAAEKVQVVYEELPAYMNARTAAAEDAIEIHPGTPNVFFEQPTVKGDDTAPLLKNAAVVREADYYLQRQPHMALEPDVGFAYFDDRGNLTIHSKSIALYMHIDMIVEGLGIEKDKLRIVQNNMGGTFGYKLSPTIEAFLGVACMATGKPVYLEYNMYQHITYTGKRSPFFINLKMGADSKGNLLGMEYDFIVDHGAYSEFGDVLATKGTQFIGAGYKIDNIRGIGKATFTNHAFGSAFRAFGSPQSFLASESMMDELAEELGMDPFEFRYQNLYREGDTTPTGCRPDVYVLPQLFDMIRPAYEDGKTRSAAESTPEKKRGVGVSLGIYCVGNDSVDAASADAELNPDGGVTIYNTWEDHGQGSDMGTLAAAHEALRPIHIPPEKIRLVMNDTDICPDSGAAAGSRSQLMVGNAIADACDRLIRAMKKDDGTFRTYVDMKKDGFPLRYTGNYETEKLCTFIDRETGQYDPFVAYMYAVFVSEVEVDTATGQTRVVKMTIAADVGKIANRLVVDGQVLGGLAQGIGLALSEDFEDLDKHTSLARCGLPYTRDVPDEIEIMYLETPRKHSSQGASGVGEVPLTSPHVSIINAINNACGVRIRELPALPAKILSKLREQ